MPRHENPNVEAEGEITHVFAHRFVVDTGSKPVLADLTPRGFGNREASGRRSRRLERRGEAFGTQSIQA
jgi:hypothetical protein